MNDVKRGQTLMTKQPNSLALLRKTGAALFVSCAIAASSLWGATFGKVVPIGGQASDIALDEGRGVLYIANFTANRIEVMNLADGSIPTSINVALQPGGLALSPDGRFLVVTHPGVFTTTTPQNNSAITIINLNANTRQTFATGFAPLAVTFTIDGQAFIITQRDFLTLDPASGVTRVVDSLEAVIARTLPIPAGTPLPNYIAAAASVSGDGLVVYGQVAAQGASPTSVVYFRYDMQSRSINIQPYVVSPGTGPNAITVNQDGSKFFTGFGLHDKNFDVISQIATTGANSPGTAVLDATVSATYPYGVLYAQVPTAVGAAPILLAADADNLTIRAQYALKENLFGRSILNAARDTIYAISDSGVTILPIGQLSQSHIISASRLAISFAGNFCDRNVKSETFDLTSTGGRVEFTITSSIPGITISPSRGFTPARITVSIDPAQFQNFKGTLTGTLTITSDGAVNIISPIRVTISNPEPDQRGTFINLSGRFVDVLADPSRQRYYAIRQDTNEILVFNSTNNQLITTLRTANTPTQMTITPQDSRYLIVGHDASYFAYVYDLETLERGVPILFTSHYPKSVAATNVGILAASRSLEVPGGLVIQSADIFARRGSTLPNLGIHPNDGTVTGSNFVLTASPNGASVFGVGANGTTLLYSTKTTPPTFVAIRKDFTSLSGAYAASSFDEFIVGDYLLNSSLVLRATLESIGTSSGFVFVDGQGYRISSQGASQPGVIQAVNLGQNPGTARAVKTTESPLLPNPVTGQVFYRSLVALSDRTGFVSLTQSGIMVLSWQYDAAAPIPTLDRIVNSADQTRPVAPGGLVSVFGSNLSPVNLTTREIPLPTALGNSCLAVNGTLIPLIFVSPGQINAQLPFNIVGNATMVLRTPGGVSNNLNFVISPTAPAIFRQSIPDVGEFPVIIRHSNNTLVTLSNPVHKGDLLTIYLTGMGRTDPTINAGFPSPGEFLATVLVEPVVTLDGAVLPVSFAGLAPGQVGVYQINVSVPFGIQQGLQIPLTITQGAGETAVNVRIVE